MRSSTLLSVLLFTACGGTWSNRDLEFAAALPSRAELSSKLPTSASSAQPLTRRDGLNAGDPSQAYADTKKAVTDFNGLLDFFLGVVDSVRSVSPTSRSGDSRTWGPFAAKDAPGFQFQVTIALVSSDPQETFGWKLQARKLGEQAWLDVVRGTFQASAETVRKGMGQIEVPVKEFRDQLKIDPAFAQLDSIVIGYVTNANPKLSTMTFTFAAGNPGGFSSAGYASRQADDGSGAMGFSLKTLDPNTSRLDIVSRWRTTGAGVAIATVAEGNYRGATRIECWDTSFKVVFFKETWPGGQESGVQSACVSIEGL
ncbi:MAG: hypothetical protein JNJ54_18280 [Myxococcaceae bacterium]|nr:hypothetical protein [Myxococcaceae bacterium]